ncbi:hypothetical protein BV509_09120 [Rhodovulum sulfidophilum]|uniref:HK97 family phage prohead protease n=1 Tax=Rhodovulum visakhapatnamense TaxID=364297 RepID=A0ABS1RK01_9RHOB|nr:HK97 family phage prohead protease [Rhodovulum visakhapatnamense]MBL3568870.1 HK97 family phage prohead protease [Rhodovulum visakhapatnamense]MBL3579222.1 HK97 family phage prohead protease [Rhodovulum visakhapatnamense]OLS44484.1 hypothetical protein BV509_09120 [Rhodovulum sulfidophilum]
MLWGASLGALEIRQEGGATRLSARFPYGAATELAPGRHEIIAPRAFANRIEQRGEIHLLAQHDYARPLASTAAGTLSLRSTDLAVEIEATVDGGTSWARDFLAAHAAGLIRGLSPGFRVAAGGERIEQRGGGLLRTITRADLFEVSAVTVPAYPQAQIEARSWEMHQDRQPFRGAVHHLNRWRL